MSLNVLTVSGRLTAAPTSREANGSTVHSFSVAVNTYAGKDKEQDVFFLECNVWGNRGNLLDKLDKGAEISVTGKLSMRKWTNKEGIERTIPTCFVNDYEVHSGKPKGEAKADPKPRTRAVKQEVVEEDVDEGDDEADIPF